MAQIKSKFIQDNAVTTAKINNGAVTNDKVGSNIDASKLGDGSVSNTKFQYINSLTSNVQTQLDAKEATANKGVAGGYASLDGNGKIPSSQIPAIAITDVFSVADITARDALTVGPGDGEVQEGDVVLVTDASADPAITSGAASYIYNGAGYSLLKAGDEVLSVNGQTGTVSLNSDNISEGSTNLYYTEARVSANVDVAANTAARHDAVTIAAGASSQVLSLTGQQVTSNAATAVTDGHMSSTDKSKLDGIEAGATGDQSDAEIKTAYENNANTNAFTDAEKSKLAGVEANAKDDQSASEVPVTPAGNITTTNVQAALQELDGLISAGTDDQTAAEVSYNDATSALGASTVQGAIEALDSTVDAGSITMGNHIFGTTLDHDGSHINFTPGTLSDWNGSVDPGQVDDALDQLASRTKTLESASAPQSASEAISLIAGDIAAEAVTLSNAPRGNSAVVSVDGIVQTPGVDYSISGTSLRFGNVADAGLTSSDLDPTSGAAPLVDGDVIVVKYEY